LNFDNSSGDDQTVQIIVSVKSVCNSWKL
jgi:hypothetical protein